MGVISSPRRDSERVKKEKITRPSYVHVNFLLVGSTNFVDSIRV